MRREVFGKFSRLCGERFLLELRRRVQVSLNKAAFTPIDVVAELTNIGTLAAFVLVSIGILILRRTQPNLHRAFRVPFVPVIPILSALASLFLIVNLPLVTIIRFIIWLALGLLIYFLYSRRKSHLREETTQRIEQAS